MEFALSGLDDTITGDLTIDFTVIGDLSHVTEYFTLFVDGTAFGTGCDLEASNDTFGFAGDDCSERDDTFQTTSLVIDEATAAGLLSDGALTLTFDFSANVDAFVDITAPVALSGVQFNTADAISFAAGGTVSYTSVPAIPLPAGLPMLAGAVGAFAVLRRRRNHS